MSQYYIDFETRSDYDLRKVSVHKYLRSVNSGIVCMAWNKDQTKTNLWLPGMPAPFVPLEGDEVFGFNIGTFDRRVWNVLGSKHNFPFLSIEMCRDVMALCGRFGLSQKLELAGRILDLKVQKDTQGKQLMRKICSPPFQYTKEELHAFYKYCLDDVNTMIELVNTLPADSLEPPEQKIWQVTMYMNDRGLPIDLRAIRRIKEVVDFYKQRETKLLPEITKGRVKTPGQVAAIRDWCAEQNVILDDLQAATVEETLEREDLPWQVRRVLQLRQELGRSSLAKYTKLLDLSYQQVIYDNLRYYRAITGRYGGLGFQAHNLPRAQVDDPDDAIKQYMTGAILKGDVMGTAKALIRSMIRALDKKTFVVSDFSSIEYILLMWLARETDHVQRFAAGFDPYKDEATRLFHVEYDQVSKEDRRKSKPVVLGAGYCLSPAGLLTYAKQYKVDMLPGESEFAINVYRRARPNVVRLWYALRDCVTMAIQTPHTDFGTNGCVFRVFKDRASRMWLRLRLPSGRAIFYMNPKLKEDTYGVVSTFMGLEATTGQWVRQRMLPSRIIENVIQALGRDLLCHCQSLIHDQGFHICLSVHDETVTMVDEATSADSAKTIHNLMTTTPDWCKDLPLQADTYISKRYKKG